MDITITAKTVKGPATVVLWQAHLSRTRQAAGDHSDLRRRPVLVGLYRHRQYDIDLIPIIAQIERAKLPLVCARSKSGGLRCYLFFSEPQPAAAVHAVLRAMAVASGTGRRNIPQTNPPPRGGQRQWVAMPYGLTFGGKIKAQVGLNRTGGEMDPPEFITKAEGKRQTADQFKELDRLEKETRKKQEKKWGPTDPERIKSALKAIDPDKFLRIKDDQRKEWFAIGCALLLRDGGGGSESFGKNGPRAGANTIPRLCRGTGPTSRTRRASPTPSPPCSTSPSGGLEGQEGAGKETIAEAENWEPPPGMTGGRRSRWWRGLGRDCGRRERRRCWPQVTDLPALRPSGAPHHSGG